ncbi:MAG: DoxX family membrane protein [Anaerolineaceae bacterium]|nr:MAG: DoxX family membrane protein [Anaerolineaceae bacterium]
MPPVEQGAKVREICSLWLYRLVRWCLAGLFVWAGAMKLADPPAFAVIISDFGLVPDWSVMPLAIALPVLEVAAALGLVVDLRGSLAVISFLLAMFIAILGYAIWLGLDIDCGCFGPEDPEARAYSSLRTSLYRDLAMAAGVFFLYWWRWQFAADRRSAAATRR